MQRNVSVQRSWTQSIYHIFYLGFSRCFKPKAKQEIESKPRVQKKLQPIQPIILPKPPKQTPPPIPNYSQGKLLPKINLYLSSIDREGISTKGYCHGLTLLWLYKMSEGLEDWFYQLNKKIIDCPAAKISDFEMDFEKFLNHIEWAQNSRKYSKNLAGKVVTDQHNVNHILQIEKIYPHKKFDKRMTISYTFRQLKTFFNTYITENVMMTFRSQDSKDKHTIGIFRRGHYYYLYDANYKTGKAKKFFINEFHELFAEIRDRLYTNFKIETIEDKIWLEPIVTRVTRKKSLRLLERAKNVEEVSLSPRKISAHVVDKKQNLPREFVRGPALSPLT